jgi:nucleotide-binding universal stress UspA family protein
MYLKPEPGGQRATYEAKRPPPDEQAWAAGRPTGAADRPTHLVLLNGAEDRAEVVLRVAGQLARQAGAAVRPAYHTPPPPGDLESIRLLTAAALGGPAADACGRLTKAARILAHRTGRPASPELLIGPADPTLSGYMRRNEFDLVTLGTEGPTLPLWAGGLWSVVAGWRPALIVGPKVSPLWAAEVGPSSEVVAVLDGTAAAEAILAPAASLSRLLDGRLNLLRATRPESTDESHRYLVDVARRIRRDVPAVRTVVSARPPAAAVLSFQGATGAIVAMASPARSWLTGRMPGGLVTRILRESTAPVLLHRPAHM